MKEILKSKIFWLLLFFLGAFWWLMVKIANEPDYISLKAGGAHELVENQKIVLLSVESDAKCNFQLINCENNQCVVLERFSLRAENDFFILGFKIRLIKVIIQDELAFIEVSKVGP